MTKKKINFDEKRINNIYTSFKSVFDRLQKL